MTYPPTAQQGSFNQNNQPSTELTAREEVLQLLSDGKNHSKDEVKAHLISKGFAESSASSTLGTLRKQGWIEDPTPQTVRKRKPSWMK